MKKIWVWGWILISAGVALYLLGLLSGVFDDMLSIGGLGLLWIGDSPAAVTLLILSCSCIINAITVFVLGRCVRGMLGKKSN